jgi:hypothetical protein
MKFSHGLSMPMGFSLGLPMNMLPGMPDCPPESDEEEYSTPEDISTPGGHGMDSCDGEGGKIKAAIRDQASACDAD